MRIVVLIDEDGECNFDLACKYADIVSVPGSSGVQEISSGLRALGHTVKILNFTNNLPALLQELSEFKTNLVFNCTESVSGERVYDVNIAGLMDLLPYPYTGAGPRGLLIGRDKSLSKTLLAQAGVKVPEHCVIDNGRIIHGEIDRYPVIVKPVYEDSSDGITLQSVVTNRKQMFLRSKYVNEKFKQPAICEQFISGRELSAFVVGRKKLKSLPIMETTFSKSWKSKYKIASSKAKHDFSYKKSIGMKSSPAALSEKEKLKVDRLSKRCFRILDMQDYGKIDMIRDESGEFYIIEGNPNPGLECKFRSLPKFNSPYQFLDLLADIVRSAIKKPINYTS